MSWLKKRRWSSECRYHHLDAMMVKNINLDYFSLPPCHSPFLPSLSHPSHAMVKKLLEAAQFIELHVGVGAGPPPPQHHMVQILPTLPFPTLMLLWSRSFCSLLNSLWPKKVLLIIWPIKKNTQYGWEGWEIKVAALVAQAPSQWSSFGAPSQWSSFGNTKVCKSEQKLWCHRI